MGFKEKCTKLGLSLLFLSLTCLSEASEGPASGDDKARSATMEAVVVTAEKREENVQEVPKSVSVISGTQTEDFYLQRTPDIVSMTPNLHVTRTGNGLMSTFASIRGITGGMTGIPALGLYVDDVYYSGLDISLLDVERIEVLRGPQGTLYGRNSEAGIINVVTRKPSEVREASVSLSTGEFAAYEAKGAVGGPVAGDWLSFKTAFRYGESDGYFENRFDGSDDGGRYENKDGRLSLAVTPSERLELMMNYDLQRYDSPKYAQFARLDQADLRNNINVDEAGKSDKQADGGSLRTEYRMSGKKLVSITSMRSEDFFMKNDVDFTPIDMTNLNLEKDAEMFSQELRFLSDDEDSALQWIGGLFFLSEKDEREYETWMNFMNMGMGVPGETLTQKSGTDTLGAAVFGEATYTFKNRLGFTLGLRYDRERKSFDYSQVPDGNVLPSMGYPAVSGSAEDTFAAWLPKATVSYRIFDDCMPYFSVSRGFRSGGFNDKDNLGSAYDPEFTWNYEIGVKTSWMRGRLNLNAALFYIDWSDMQVEVPTSDGTSVYIENAGEATSQGAELELAARPVNGLDLLATMAYTDAEYEDYSNGATVYDGNTIMDAPEYTMNFGATYRFKNGIFLNGKYARFGEIWFDPGNTRSQENYGLAAAKVGYETERFDVYVYGRNLFDEEYATRAFEVNGAWYGRAGAPKAFGVMLTGRF